jgi:hypothetical protein
MRAADQSEKQVVGQYTHGTCVSARASEHASVPFDDLARRQVDIARQAVDNPIQNGIVGREVHDQRQRHGQLRVWIRGGTRGGRERERNVGRVNEMRLRAIMRASLGAALCGERNLLRARNGEQRALHELLAKHEAKQKVNDNDDDLDDNQRPDLRHGQSGSEREGSEWRVLQCKSGACGMRMRVIPRPQRARAARQRVRCCHLVAVRRRRWRAPTRLREEIRVENHRAPSEMNSSAKKNHICTRGTAPSREVSWPYLRQTWLPCARRSKLSANF